MHRFPKALILGPFYFHLSVEFSVYLPPYGLLVRSWIGQDIPGLIGYGYLSCLMCRISSSISAVSIFSFRILANISTYNSFHV